MLIIGGIEKRKWFGARHTGHVGEMRQWCFEVVCGGRGSRGLCGSGEMTRGLVVETDSSCESVWKCRVGSQEGDLVGDRLAVEKELGVGSRESRIVGRVL